jgi:hypothetical protein
MKDMPWELQSISKTALQPTVAEEVRLGRAARGLIPCEHAAKAQR